MRKRINNLFFAVGLMAVVMMFLFIRCEFHGTMGIHYKS